MSFASHTYQSLVRESIREADVLVVANNFKMLSSDVAAFTSLGLEILAMSGGKLGPMVCRYKTSHFFKEFDVTNMGWI